MSLKRFLLKHYYPVLILEMFYCSIFLIGGIALMVLIWKADLNNTLMCFIGAFTFTGGLFMFIGGLFWSKMTYDLFNPLTIKTSSRKSQKERSESLVRTVFEKHGFKDDYTFEIIHPNLDEKILKFYRKIHPNLDNRIRKFFFEMNPFPPEIPTHEFWVQCHQSKIEIRSAAVRGTAFKSGWHYLSYDLYKIKKVIIEEINKNKTSFYTGAKL